MRVLFVSSEQAGILHTLLPLEAMSPANNK